MNTPFPPNIAEMNVHICSKTLPKLTVPGATASNITQPNTTIMNVYSQLKNAGIFSSTFPRNSRSITIRIPK